MFENLKDMGKLLKQAKEMKSKMKDVQDELKKLIVEVSNKTNTITMKMTGEMEVTEITIDPSILSEKNAEKIEKSLKQVFNQASGEAKEAASTKLAGVSKGLNIPGLG